MLLLLFRVAGDAYAIKAGRVVEVVPRVALRSLPYAPEALAGMFRYRGRVLPVIDLGVLLGVGPCPLLLSTRIILVDDRTQGRQPGRDEARLGLIAERVSDVRRVADHQVIPPSPLMVPNPYLGPIVSDDSGLIPLIDVERIMAEPIRRALAEAAP